MRAVNEERIDRSIRLIPSPGMIALKNAGLSAGWAMPVALWDAPEGFDTSARPDNRPFHTLGWRVSGGCVRRVLPPTLQTVEELTAGGFFLQSASRNLWLVANEPIRLAHFYMSEAFVQTAATEYLGGVSSQAEILHNERVMRSDPQLVPELDAYLRRAFDQEEPATRLEMDSRASLLVLHLLKHHSVAWGKIPDRKRGGLPPRHLRRVCDAMTSDLRVEVPLRTLAALVDISYHHFCHAFKVSTGTAPYQWLVETRVAHACELLRTTGHPVADIAAAVGYDDPSQFTRVFRSRRGMTPCAYRRQW
jgi:AraC family transcriptional regulator